MRGRNIPPIRHHIDNQPCLAAPACQFPILHRRNIVTGNRIEPAISRNHSLGQKLGAAARLNVGRFWHAAGFVIQNGQPAISQLVNPVRPRLDFCPPCRRVNRQLAVNFHMSSGKVSAPSPLGFNKPG